MANWWKCQIVGDDRTLINFKKGEVIFAKKEEEFIALFDGRKGLRIPRSGSRNIKVLSRLDAQESSSIDLRYQGKEAPESLPAWDPGTVRD